MRGSLITVLSGATNFMRAATGRINCMLHVDNLTPYLSSVCRDTTSIQFKDFRGLLALLPSQ
ncbi:hypothetical protein Amsp01_044300 [Amycolatopsis sp. NBRC 101858]|nr:hypothetical protein Amsp01_044300 [Amycolatopsis sp. NBRC 101858]